MNVPNTRTDQQLIDEADKGLRGQGAVVEMMQRLKDAVVKLDQTSAMQQDKMLRLTRWIATLTWVMVIVGIIQVVPLLIKVFGL